MNSKSSDTSDIDEQNISEEDSMKHAIPQDNVINDTTDFKSLVRII